MTTPAPTKKEILAQAADVLGGRDAACHWLARPALAFGWRKPREVMATAEGHRQVATLLVQIEFGVYV